MREIKERVTKAVYYIDRAITKTFIFGEIEDRESIIECISFRGKDIIALLKNIRRDLEEAYNTLSEIIEEK